jgi:hypothetical protein
VLVTTPKLPVISGLVVKLNKIYNP